jgi:hypothetical protein
LHLSLREQLGEGHEHTREAVRSLLQLYARMEEAEEVARYEALPHDEF